MASSPAEPQGCRSAEPAVSVIVGAYNAMPYFEECLESILTQTIGRSRMELIVVDDGSTDGTGDYAESLAKKCPDLMTVLHQENSGGPARPRNVGLKHARGRYVYFVDADDYIGPEALERLVEAAEAERSDVVLGKMVGVGGRGVPASMYRRTDRDVDLFTSRVYWTLAGLKLFRRSLLDEHTIRFDETLKTGEDQPFTAMAYLKAQKISVLADYDYYFARRRDDGQNTTKQLRDLEPRVALFTSMMDLIGRNVPPGPGRDHLMRRHLEVEFLAYLNRAAHGDPERRDRYFERFRASVDTWVSEELAASTVSAARLQLFLLQRGDFERLGALLTRMQEHRKAHNFGAPRWHHLPPEHYHLRGNRCYADYPFFEDEQAGLPLDLFDVTQELPASYTVQALGRDGFEIRVVGHAPVSAAALISGGSQIVQQLKDIEVEDVSCAVRPEPSLTLRGRASQMPSEISWNIMILDPTGPTVLVPVERNDDDRFSVTVPILGEGVRTVYFAAGSGALGTRIPVRVPRLETGVARGMHRFRPWFTRVETRRDVLRVRSERRRIIRGLRRRLRR